MQRFLVTRNRTYEYGKFGLKSLDGLVILDAIYDDIDVWENANVIQVRLGDKHYYFNDQKEQILTDEPSCMEQDVPYWDGMGWNHFMVREFVDKVSDNHTYISNVGLVRIDHREVKEIASMLQANCERIPMKIESIKELTDQYSYEFGMNILKLKASVGQAVKRGDTVIILEAMKMEIPVVAPQDGTVASIDVAVGDAVEAGGVLATMN